MSEISESKLKEEIHAFLKNADLNSTSRKKVIIALEKKLKVDLNSRKEEIDKIVMDYVNSMDSDEGEKSEKSESESEESDSDQKTKRKTRGGGGAAKGKKAAATKPKRAGGTKGKGTGFTRSYKLSPALSELMGADEMPRHAVVKRIWALVKENQMFDPNNKQFAICDDKLLKVIGKPRFRVFGMMKYLKNHFIVD